MKLRQEAPAGALFVVLYVASTWLFVEVHEDLRVAHGILVYLLLIIGAAATSGRLSAFAMVVAGYLAVDWLFIPPIGRLGAPRILDGILLAGFVCVGFVVSELLVRYREASAHAERRLGEIERLGDERRRMAEQIARASARDESDQVKNALLASIAHDLRAPLATIRLQAGQDGASEAIASEAARLSGYLDALVSFVRADGVMAPRAAGNIAEDLVGAAVRSAGAALQGHAVRVQPALGDEMLLGDFDFALAHRALVNLLENAARYSPAGLELEIQPSRAGDRLSITVLDRGPGLAPAEVERVFTPLERGSAAAGKAGSGLGLAIARTFARAQGGDVRYASRPGGGSAFTLELRARRS